MTIQRFGKSARMSQAVVHGSLVYLSGQVGEGATTAEQTTSILNKIDALLAEAGTDKSQLLSATIWLKDMADFNVMNGVWEKWIDADNPPARATVEVRLAFDSLLVEIQVTAALKG